jgi:F0F1-type ATP synthase alpha subunit
LLFNFVLEYAIRRVRLKEDGLKLNGAHQHLVYGDDVNILGGSIHTVKKNTEALVFANKEAGLEVNADKTKYMFMSRDQNVGRSQNVKTDNNSFEIVKDFKYLGKILTNQNYIQEKIKSRFKSGNACYHSVQNLLSYSLLSKNLKINVYRPINLPVVLYGCETWSFTLREERRLRVFVNRVLR